VRRGRVILGAYSVAAGEHCTIAPNPDFAAVTRRFIMEMPIAAHFGFDLTDIQPGFLEVTQPYRRELSFRDGMFQAGAVGTIADFAGAGACVTMLPEGWGGATADYTIKLLASAGGERLVARGRLVQFGRTLSVAAADVFSVRDGQETLCATALITARIFPKAGA
jgi:uncharacterized protein (TIGR00369 family)